MKIIKQFSIILTICLVGEVIAYLLPFEFPGSVIALILTAALLFLNILKEAQIKETADFFLGNMSMFFIPFVVEVSREIGVFKNQILLIFVLVVISLIATFLGGMFTVLLVKKVTGRRYTDDGNNNR